MQVMLMMLHVIDQQARNPVRLNFNLNLLSSVSARTLQTLSAGTKKRALTQQSPAEICRTALTGTQSSNRPVQSTYFPPIRGKSYEPNVFLKNPPTLCTSKRV